MYGPLLRSLAVLLLALGLLSLTACEVEFGEANAEQADEDGEEKKDTAVPVAVAPLARGAIEAVLRYSTNLEAENQVMVQAEAARRVVKLLVEEGDEVARGQILVRLQDEEQRLDLAKVESELAKVEREYDRQKRLFGQGLIAEEAFNQATYEIEQLGLSKEEAERQLSYTEVRAPIAGVVTSRDVSLGDTVTLNQPLFEIVDFDSIVARVFVPEKELSRLGKGLDARITAPALGERRFDGSVERIAPVVDPASGTVKVTVAIPRTAGLRPGLYVDVQLVTDVHEDALLIPKKALVYDADQVFVYRLDGADTVEKVLLHPALEDKEFVEPAAGFSDADRIVVAGQVGLKDGAKIRLVGEAAAAGVPAELERTGEAL